MATKRRVSRQKPSKAKPVEREIRRAATRAGIAKKPGEWVISGPPFDGGEGLRHDATCAELMAVAFGADPDRLSFMAGALQAAIDDFELLEAVANDEINMSDLIRRCALRAGHRLKVAVEVDRRMAAAVGTVQS